MYYIGIDPDLHTMPVAVVDDANRLVYLEVYRVPKTKSAHDAITAMAWETRNLAANIVAKIGSDLIRGAAVEAQEIYAGRTKNPRNILHLGNVAGVALGAVARMGCKTTFVLPVQWKGTVPKEIHHQRILTKAGYTTLNKAGGKNPYYYPADEKRFDLVMGEWEHACDAIGLAQWAAKQASLRSVGWKAS